MATKAVYDECIRLNRARGLRDFRTGSYIPNLKALFGKKELIDKREFERCSEGEQRRHLGQDNVLRALYIECNSYPKSPINNPHMVRA